MKVPIDGAAALGKVVRASRGAESGRGNGRASAGYVVSPMVREAEAPYAGVEAENAKFMHERPDLFGLWRANPVAS
ncbi:hypothetical protein ACTPOE_17085 [Castellaniella sp. WN]